MTVCAETRPRTERMARAIDEDELESILAGGTVGVGDGYCLERKIAQSSVLRGLLTLVVDVVRRASQ